MIRLSAGHLVLFISRFIKLLYLWWKQQPGLTASLKSATPQSHDLKLLVKFNMLNVGFLSVTSERATSVTDSLMFVYEQTQTGSLGTSTGSLTSNNIGSDL